MATGTDPSVTVVLPLDPGAGAASSAVECVLRSDVAVELVLVHDGREADVVQALRAGDPERVRALAHPDRGVARALSLGVALARAPWVCAVAPHERWKPGALERMLASVEPVDGAVGFVSPAADGSMDGLAGMLFSDVLPPGAGALLRTDDVRAVGGWDPTLREAHHLDVWLRLLERGRLVRGADVLVDEPSRRRRMGEREPEPTRRERASVLSRALTALRAEEFGGEGSASASPAASLARIVARTGLAELRPFVVDLVAASRAAGEAEDAGADAAVASLLRGAGLPERGPSTGAVIEREAPSAEPWLRVALEVESLDRGGLENVVADLAVAIRDLGVEPVVFCTQRGGARADEVRAAGIDVVVLRSADRAHELGALLDERRIDLLNPHFSTVGVRAAAERGIPVVPTLHNAYAWVGASVVDDVRSLDRFVAGYTAVSRFVAEFSARRFAIDPERIRVIPNAYRAGGSGRRIDRATARRELGLLDDVPLLLQVGRVDPVKCQLALVDAVAELRRSRPDLRAWVAGSRGDPGYAARVEERLAQDGSAAVTLLGERDDVDRLLAAADVFVMPSVLEGLSLSVIEALAAGVPAVLTRTGDAAFLLGDDEPLPGALIDGPVVDPLTIEGEELFRIASADHPPHASALAAAVERVLDDLSAMRDRARRRGEELAAAFAPDDVVAQYADVFARVVAGTAHEAARDFDRRREALEGAELRRARARADLRAAVGDGSRGLGATLALAHEREAALRHAGALSWELRAMRGEADATAEVAEQLLSKLRLGRRLRDGLEAVRRRVLGASPRSRP